MRDIIATLDSIADSLEAAGLYCEAESLDTISNTVEAGRLRSIPTRRQMPSPPDLDEAMVDDIVDKHEAETDLALDAVVSGMNRFMGVLDKVATENPDLAQKVRAYKARVAAMRDEMHGKLKDILVFIIQQKGGVDRSMQSIDRRGT